MAKHIGAFIDEKLNGKDHNIIANVTSKLFKSTAIVFKCSRVIDAQSMHTVLLIFLIIH